MLVDGDFDFSRGSNLAATRIGSDGLIEKGRENLLLQSNSFLTTWTQVSISPPTSGQAGYDGSTDAWYFEKTGAFGRLQQSISTSGVQTLSVYLKAKDSSWVNIEAGGNNTSRQYFDLNAPIETAKGSSSNIISSSIEDAGDGWRKCSITYEGTKTFVFIFIAEGNGQINGTSGSLYIQDSQLEIGLVATDYIESGATTGKAGLLEDEPRFDYSGGATCPALLLEPSRTQLISHSEYFGAWNLNTAGISSIQPNNAVSPEGLQNAYKVNFVVQSDSDLALAQTHSITGGSTYTYSIYIKGEGSNIGKDVVIKSKRNGGGDSAGTTTIQTLTNEWKRIDFATTYAANNPQGRLLISSNDATSCLVYGAQAELGSYPTSYIPNHSGGSVTRGADFCNGAGDSSTFNDSEGVLYAEVKTSAPVTSVSNSLMLSINDSSNFNEVRFEFFTSNRLYASVRGSNGEASTVQTITQTDYNKIAIKYTSSGSKFFLNGVGYAFGGKSISGLNAFSFSRANTTTSPFYGDVKQVLTFKTALSDTDCIALTT